jgi:DNA-directed RNA polymerase subunit K/omega
MVSAFITAITHFRSEFEMSEKAHVGRVIPISDVIRAVPTKNLICAFITITSASRAQEIRMETFAAAVGERYDDIFRDAPKEFRDDRIAVEMDGYFEKFLDGRLLKKYKIEASEDAPPKYKKVVSHAREINGEEPFNLFELANAMFEGGMQESEAYFRIYQGLKEGILSPEGGFENGTYVNDSA